MNRLFPLFLNLAGRAVVVIGGGEVADRKIEALLEAGAVVTVIAPESGDRIREWAECGAVRWVVREYRGGDLAAAWLVIGATDDRKVNEAVAGEAAARGVWCNIVDVPELCTFYMGSSITRGDLKLAISTNGRSPAVAAMLRRKLESGPLSGYDVLVDELGRVRDDIRKRFPDDPARRSRILKRIACPESLHLLQENRYDEFRSLVEECLSSL